MQQWQMQFVHYLFQKTKLLVQNKRTKLWTCHYIPGMLCYHEYANYSMFFLGMCNSKIMLHLIHYFFNSRILFPYRLDNMKGLKWLEWLEFSYMIWSCIGSSMEK